MQMIHFYSKVLKGSGKHEDFSENILIIKKTVGIAVGRKVWLQLKNTL